MAIVVPWSDFDPQIYRYADYGAYFRKVKGELLKSLSEPKPGPQAVVRRDNELCVWELGFQVLGQK